MSGKNERAHTGGGEAMLYCLRALIVVALLTVLVPATFAQSISSRLQGSVIICDYNTELRGETCWIGCTLLQNNGDEYDFPAKRVTGRGTATFSISSPMERQANAYVVGLWRSRVNKCGCAYCRENGFHLEGRLASDRGDIVVASEQVSWQRIGQAIKFFSGKSFILEIPRRINLERGGDREAQRELCARIETLLDLTVSLAGMPGTGGVPPICSIAARGEGNQKIAEVDVSLLQTEEGFFYGLKATGFWGSVVADGLRDLGFIEVEPRVFVRHF